LFPGCSFERCSRNRSFFFKSLLHVFTLQMNRPRCWYRWCFFSNFFVGYKYSPSHDARLHGKGPSDSSMLLLIFARLKRREVWICCT
jgi:hypothetical protein